MTPSIRNVTVLGVGTMGEGIAQVTASAGLRTILFDAMAERATLAISRIDGRLSRLVAKGTMDDDRRSSALAALGTADDVPSACLGTDLVIEATPEDMARKVELLAGVVAAAPSHAVLASSTSSLSITEMGARIGASERVLGLHFFNPAPVMALLEIVRGMGTSQATVEAALAFCTTIGKTAIVVRDVAGFATSRLGVAVGAEAIRMVESGVASVVDIDRAMELGYGHPMGPLKLTDWVGLDVRLAILEHLHREIGEQFRPPALLRQMVRCGRLGKKSGAGFYLWKGGVAQLPPEDASKSPWWR